MADLFDEPSPGHPPEKQKTTAELDYEARRLLSCERPYSPPVKTAKPNPVASYRCRVGGGDACYSDGHGWFCHLHRPVGFLPKDPKR